MAFLEFRNVRIAGVAAGVPKHISSNLHPDENDNVSSDYTPEDFIATTGVKERRTSLTLCTSDLCYGAAERLIEDLHWDKNEIGAIVFVSQTADYILPATACILQDRLGLSKECYATDCSLGCSGWVYGLSHVVALLANGDIKKALLLVGDAKKRFVGGKKDPLFGSAGTATAIEYREGANGFQFHFGTDGSGFDAIITPAMGSREPVSPASFDDEVFEDKTINRLTTRMKGMDVFSFGITTVPKSVKQLADHFNFEYLDADYFVFHQANMKMVNFIAKKLKLPAEKVPSCMYHFGNTSSASIPLTMVTELKDKLQRPTKLLCCGFGVGLSWGTVFFESDNIVISDLVELEDSETSTYVV